MKQAFGYIRVSTAGQADEGISLEAQQAKIEAWCLVNDIELAGCFIDAGISGKPIAKNTVPTWSLCLNRSIQHQPLEK